MLSPSENGSQRSGDLAFGLVVLASLIMLVTAQVLNDRPVLLVAVVLACLLFLGVGTAGFRWVEKANRPALTAVYYLLQLLIGGAVTILSRGSPWLLMLPLVSQAFQGLRRVYALILMAAVWLLEILPIILAARWDQIFSAGSAYLAGIVFVAVFTQLLVSEQQARRDLGHANLKLREYASKVEELATAQERNRLAREIHDGLGHYLTAINIQIKAAQATVQQDPPQAAAALNNAQTLTQEALADVRRSISSLRADPATNRPLRETLAELVQESQAAGIETRLQVLGEPKPLASQVEFTLYRVAQEGLTNVRKHARATQAELVLDYRACCGATPGAVKLRVQDNGQGSEQTGHGFGLTGLEERVQLMGGVLRVESAPGQGFLLSAEIPT